MVETRGASMYQPLPGGIRQTWADADGRGRGVDDERTDLALLVAAADRGDQEAWNEIVDRFAPLLASVLMGYRLSNNEREDIAQTVWLRLIEHLGQLREPRALPMW